VSQTRLVVLDDARMLWRTASAFVLLAKVDGNFHLGVCGPRQALIAELLQDHVSRLGQLVLTAHNLTSLTVPADPPTMRLTTGPALSGRDRRR
jgi:hypothetical protein